MAKILKTAEEAKKDWKLEVTCTDNKSNVKNSEPCYYLIEVTSSDIVKVSEAFYNKDFYGFVCPNCGRFAQIDEHQIPDYIKKNAEKYQKPKELN